MYLVLLLNYIIQQLLQLDKKTYLTDLEVKLVMRKRVLVKLQCVHLEEERKKMNQFLKKLCVF